MREYIQTKKGVITYRESRYSFNHHGCNDDQYHDDDNLIIGVNE